MFLFKKIQEIVIESNKKIKNKKKFEVSKEFEKKIIEVVKFRVEFEKKKEEFVK